MWTGLKEEKLNFYNENFNPHCEHVFVKIKFYNNKNQLIFFFVIKTLIIFTFDKIITMLKWTKQKQTIKIYNNVNKWTSDTKTIILLLTLLLYSNKSIIY
jgi:hypothetical protein